MSSFNLPYKPKSIKEKFCSSCTQKGHTIFSVQNIIVEIIKNHLITNDPEVMGYGFTQKFDLDPLKTDIFVDITNNFKLITTGKRPAVYVGRDPAIINSSQTIGQSIGKDIANSLDYRTAKISLPVNVMCLAYPLGFAETFADYIKYPFMYFAQEIEREYCFHKFRLVNILPATAFSIDAKDTFGVELKIQIEFSDTWIIQGDDLKLKTFNTTIIDSAGAKLKNQ